MTALTELSDRSLGWLRYLYRKVHTPDDWNREGRPHPHWDDRSDPPMASWPRFDLVDSSYAMALMARTTPAWREPYVAVLDQLVEVQVKVEALRVQRAFADEEVRTRR